MNYEVGDRVRIKTWAAMKKEYGTNIHNSIICYGRFNSVMEEDVEALNTNRVVTINEIKIHEKCYIMKELTNYYWTDDMIKGKEKPNDNIQKQYRDLLGRTLQVGDKVLHLWVKNMAYNLPEGGPHAVNHKLATVLRFGNGTVRIQYRKQGIIKESSIHNPRNRLIILKKEELSLSEGDIIYDTLRRYEGSKKTQRTRYNNLKEELTSLQISYVDIEVENKELRKAIKLLTEGSHRFRNLDI